MQSPSAYFSGKPPKLLDQIRDKIRPKLLHFDKKHPRKTDAPEILIRDEKSAKGRTV